MYALVNLERWQTMRIFCSGVCVRVYSVTLRTSDGIYGFSYIFPGPVGMGESDLLAPPKDECFTEAYFL